VDDIPRRAAGLAQGQVQRPAGASWAIIGASSSFFSNGCNRTSCDAGDVEKAVGISVGTSRPSARPGQRSALWSAGLDQFGLLLIFLIGM